MRWLEKEYVVHVRDLTEKELFLSLVEPLLERNYIAIKSRLGKLSFKIAGTKEQINETTYELKELIESTRLALRPDGKGFYVYYSTFLFKTTKSIISMDALAFVLQSQGYKATVVPRGIKTNCNFESLKEILYSLKEIQKSIPPRLSKPVKSILLTVSYVTNKNPNDVLELALNKGYLYEGSQGIRIKKDPSLIVQDLNQATEEDYYEIYAQRAKLYEQFKSQEIEPSIVIKHKDRKNKKLEVVEEE